MKPDLDFIVFKAITLILIFFAVCIASAIIISELVSPSSIECTKCFYIMHNTTCNSAWRHTCGLHLYQCEDGLEYLCVTDIIKRCVNASCER